MTKYQFRQDRKQEKLETKQRKKFERKSNSKLKWLDTWLYRVLVRIIPISALLYFGLKTTEYLTTTEMPHPKLININILGIDIINRYFSLHLLIFS